jgi:hypothetical protein
MPSVTYNDLSAVGSIVVMSWADGRDTVARTCGLSLAELCRGIDSGRDAVRWCTWCGSTALRNDFELGVRAVDA